MNSDYYIKGYWTRLAAFFVDRHYSLNISFHQFFTKFSKSPNTFLKQVFNQMCKNDIYRNTYVKIGRRTTQTRKGTAISHFPEYFIHFILFHHLVTLRILDALTKIW